MSYSIIAAIARSQSLRTRIEAGIAKERVYAQTPLKGDAAAQQIAVDQRNLQYLMLRFAAQAGWESAWASAVASGIEDPGADDAVITDEMIFGAISAVAIE